jgi:GTP cyclohydrolase II
MWCRGCSAGIIIYFRKEGRALGEVTKYLVYNRRKRQEGGDTAAEYFNCTQHVAGIMDMRFQVCWCSCVPVSQLLGADGEVVRW